MTLLRLKCLLVAVFSLFATVIFAQPHHEGNEGEKKEHETGKKKKFNATEVIFGHVLNAHEFHFMDIGDKPVTVPLPVILYSPQRGFTSFMSSRFEHGHKIYENYAILTAHSIQEMGLDPKKFFVGSIVGVNDAGEYDPNVKVYDLSLTRNVVQMLLALIVFVWIMLRIAKRYKSGVGVTSAPKGSQSLLEPVITFVRDEVAKPNLGHKYEKYLPYLLTIFFLFLLITFLG